MQFAYFVINGGCERTYIHCDDFGEGLHFIFVWLTLGEDGERNSASFEFHVGVLQWQCTGISTEIIRSCFDAHVPGFRTHCGEFLRENYLNVIIKSQEYFKRMYVICRFPNT